MRVLRLSEIGDEAAAKEAAEAMRAGGVVLFPAERLYGLAAALNDPEGVEKVFRMKARTRGAALPVLAASREMAEEWVQLSGLARALAERFWPGPLTLVLPLKRLPGPPAAGESRTLGIRVPGSELARKLAEALGLPPTATSANLSGRREEVEAMPAARSLRETPDLILDAGRLPGPPGSTVLKVEGDRFQVIREGAIPLENIGKALR